MAGRSRPKTRQQRRCLHVYFYYMDREFGWMHVRLQTWFPFAIQVCINGREWLGQKLRRAGMALASPAFAKVAGIVPYDRLAPRTARNSSCYKTAVCH